VASFKILVKELRIWRSRRIPQDLEYFKYKDLDLYYPPDLCHYYKFKRLPHGKLKEYAPGRYNKFSISNPNTVWDETTTFTTCKLGFYWDGSSCATESNAIFVYFMILDDFSAVVKDFNDDTNEPGRKIEIQSSTSDIVIDYWIKAGSTSGTTLGESTGCSNTCTIQIEDNSGCNFHFKKDGTTQLTEPDCQFTNWHHIFVTMGDPLKVYVNRELKLTYSYPFANKHWIMGRVGDNVQFIKTLKVFEADDSTRLTHFLSTFHRR